MKKLVVIGLIACAALMSAGCDELLAPLEESVYITVFNGGEVPFATFQRGKGTNLREAIPVLYPREVAIAECKREFLSERDECILVARALGPTIRHSTEEAHFGLPRVGDYDRDASWEVSFWAPEEEED